MGNPLTFHDPVSSTYGSARFGHNEGFHGQLVTRFGLLEGKAWYRDIREAERDFFQVFCIMHSLAMEQRRPVQSFSFAHERRVQFRRPPTTSSLVLKTRCPSAG